MVHQKVIVKNPTGLHLRPAGVLCNEAVKYKSRVYFHYGDDEANAKSVLSVLGACIKCGTELEFDPAQYPAVVKKCALVWMRYEG